MWSDFPCKFTGSIAKPKKRIGNKIYVLARLILEKKLGRPIEPGLLACHECDNKLCVEPEHLYEGTYVDNASDAFHSGKWHPWGRKFKTGE